MAHPHHCMVSQKLQSTYFNVLYAYFNIVVKYVHVYNTRILLLDLTYGRTVRRSRHWLSWIIRLPVPNTDRRHCKKDDDDDDDSCSISYNTLLHLRIKRRPHWVRSRAVRTRVYCVNGTWDGRISELFRAAVTYHWAHVTPTDTSMQFYLADCKDLGTIPPEFGTLVQIVCHITWVFASFTHFPSLRIFVFFAYRVTLIVSI